MDGGVILVTVLYDFYKNTYGGSNTEDVFNSKLGKAIKLVKNRTNNSISSIEDDNENQELVSDIRSCICEVIDKCYLNELNNGKILTSQTSGKLSESYAVDLSRNSFGSEISGIVKTWLEEYGYTNFVWI